MKVIVHGHTMFHNHVMPDEEVELVSSSLSCRPSGYLSSPHIGQEPAYSRDPQQGPVISSPVVPAAASGKQVSQYG